MLVIVKSRRHRLVQICRIDATFVFKYVLLHVTEEGPPDFARLEEVRSPPWNRVEGKGSVNFRGMLPDSGSVLRGVPLWEVPFALMLSPGWKMPTGSSL